MISGDPVAEDIRIDDRQFAELRAGNHPAAMRKALQAVAGGEDFTEHARSGPRVEPREVTIDVLYLAKGSRRPDYSHGGGTM